MMVLWIVAAVLAVLLLCIVFTTSPRLPRKEAEEFARLNYAHRGLHTREIPENSLAAFRAAVDAGYAIELDVQLTKDGKCVVFHDDTLMRMCGEAVPGGVIDYTLEELSRFRLGETEESIPTLEEVLSAVDGRVALLIEVKKDGDGIATLKEALSVLEGYSGKYCIESFSPPVLRYLKKHAKKVVRGQLSFDFWHKDPYKKPIYVLCGLLLFNFLSRPDFIAYRLEAGKNLPMRLMRLYGAYTLAYTVKSEEAASLSERYGFDGMIFEEIAPPAEGYFEKHEADT